MEAIAQVGTEQDAWDDICVSPYESQMQLGREEGREAGLQAGFNDGFALGRTKGVEFGMELGFIKGFLNTVGLNSIHDEASVDRVKKRVDDLRRAMDEFPLPDDMFEIVDRETLEDGEEAETMHTTDVLAALQSIKSKFKVLAILLKVPQYSLKQVMADVAAIEVDKRIRANGSDAKLVNEKQAVSSEW